MPINNTSSMLHLAIFSCAETTEVSVYSKNVSYNVTWVGVEILPYNYDCQKLYHAAQQHIMFNQETLCCFLEHELLNSMLTIKT